MENENVSNELANKGYSGIHTQSLLTSESNEVSFTHNNVAAQSTPTTTRVKELSMDCLLYTSRCV